MEWYLYPIRIIAGAFLANGVPHFVNGISGKKFQSPFASPPAVGESSPIVNVLWGMANFVIGYFLLYGVGEFAGGLNGDVLMVAVGMLVTGIGLAWHFGNVRGGSA
ncbi:MAG: hypothetical protein JXO48_04525 [Deltaproteobacteria bacterium]|nr:hypothetical protein [Deltaproteobacteria bacterium]